MRRTVVNTLALAFALTGVSIALGQQAGAPSKTVSPPAKVEDTPKAKTPTGQSQLEQMLAQALKNNPDIRVASAKATMAEAELNRARLQVTQEVIRLHHALLSQRATVAYQAKKFERIKNLQATNAVSSEIVDEAQDALTAAKAKLAELEAQMNALVGKSSREANADDNALRQRAVEFLSRTQYVSEVSTAEELFRQVLEQHKPAGPIAERIRTALGKHITLKVEGEFVSEVLQHVEKQASVTIKLMEGDLPEPKLKLELTDLPLVAVLQYIEDSEPGWRFVVREYGIMFAPNSKLPPGAVRVQEFLRQKPTEEPRQQPRGGNNPPAESVEGVVKSVDGSGSMTISIGSDAGLAKGQMLELHWKPHKPPIEDAHPFGKVRVVEVEAHQAVVQPVGDVARRLQLGDRIIAQILKK
jgi:hypothetical protein